MSNKTVTLDVREDIQNGREPFGKIMRALGALKESQDLVIIAPFQPKPLFGILAQRGYGHIATPLENGDWRVHFSRKTQTPAAASVNAESPPKAAVVECAATPVIDVDARGLEPPGPLVRILEAIATLPEGAALRAFTDRRPMHLYAQLKERGFVGDSEEQKDGSFVTYVRRG